LELVNIVRSEEQAELLKGLGSRYVVNSQDSDFMEQLIAALVETGATLAFDAIGGGKLGGQILTAMEAAAVKRMTVYSRYGSDAYKELYIYGGLDMGPTQFTRNFGFSWSINGFLLTPFMAKAGPEVVARMRKRVANELTTTFKSHYSQEISLTDALKLDVVQAYNAKRTGDKYLIRPHG
jgi:NADPH2:quinone reductase